MKRIWKYTVPLRDFEIVRPLPIGAQVLTVQTQHDEPMLWALVDPDESRRDGRLFRWYGTGHDMPDDPGVYCGTVQLYDGDLIFHLFETTGVER